MCISYTSKNKEKEKLVMYLHFIGLYQNTINRTKFDDKFLIKINHYKIFHIFKLGSCWQPGEHRQQQLMNQSNTLLVAKIKQIHNF